LAEFQESSFDPSRHQCERLAEATEGVPIDISGPRTHEGPATTGFAFGGRVTLPIRHYKLGSNLPSPELYWLAFDARARAWRGAVAENGWSQ
jgi:hypothetical protein